MFYENNFILNYVDNNELLDWLNEEIYQTNSPNCYMLSWLKILKNIPWIREKLEESIFILNDWSYRIKIPFIWQGHIINISKKDISIKYDKRWTYFNRISFPILWPKIMQILEAVYTKVLLENSRVKYLEDWWRPLDIIRLFLGEQYIKNKTLIILDKSFEKNYNKTLSNLSNYLNNIDLGKNTLFIYRNNHFYNVESINTEKQEISLLDPFTMNKKDIYKYHELISFSELYTVQIDLENKIIEKFRKDLLFTVIDILE